MKKTTKKLIYLILSGMLITNIGCNKIADFGDTNVNPNGSSSVEPGTLISTVQTRLGSRTFGANDPAATTLEGFYCQYFAEPTYPGSSRYSIQAVNATGYYSGVLEDCQYIIDVNTDPAKKAASFISGANASQIAIARIMKAYIYWQITDLYGDMPYSEALKGAANIHPKYDAQESIYKDMIKELTESIAQFDEVGPTVKGDLIYNGSITKWRKLANSMRMQMALRLSKRYPNAGDYAATEFNKAMTSSYGFINSNADNFTLSYAGNTLQFNNPWNATGNSADLGESKTMTDALTGFGDTRIAAFGTNANGVPYGLSSGAPTGVTYAKILNTSFKAVSSNFVFISAATSLLTQAEGIERGWTDLTTADAKTAYDAGVTASFAQWGVALPATYINGGAADYVGGAGTGSVGGASVAGSNVNTSTKLQRIAAQQWFAYYPLGRQGWANWRRTNFPVLAPTNQATVPGTPIPRRLPYGPNDYSLNATQVAIAVAALGGDTQDKHVWWDL